jgi:hypothetical protein
MADGWTSGDDRAAPNDHLAAISCSVPFATLTPMVHARRLVVGSFVAIGVLLAPPVDPAGATAVPATNSTSGTTGTTMCGPDRASALVAGSSPALSLVRHGRVGRRASPLRRKAVARRARVTQVPCPVPVIPEAPLTVLLSASMAATVAVVVVRHRRRPAAATVR